MPTDKPTVWVVDDDDSTRAYLWDFLSSRGYDVQCVDSGDQVMRRLGTSRPSLLILDIRMPHIGGLEVLAQMEKVGRRIPAIVLSGVDQVSTVVKAMRLGAADYLLKPLDEHELELSIQKVLAANGSGDSEDLAQPSAEVAFPSTNKRMQQIKAICDQVAPADVPVLILGES